ncbi:MULTISPECIES: hypothetical protein [Caballeronia]|uniref:hypothetical protein n=1 Tax=Caballeronia TaxID=1827195 RepID=UPI00286CC985|nr:hypothetical protein [Caballeronia sp. LZ025]
MNALTVNAQNVDNQAGADLNSAATSVNAANAITNEGRIEGDTVATTSATLVNTATIIGNQVTLTGTQSIVNDGAAAVMAAASELNLYSRGDISNTNGANIFSLGDINIAGDGTRDANGLLANRANTVTNDQSTIEAQGNIEVATDTLNNTRPAPTVETVTTDVETLHQTKRSKYIACTTTGGDKNAGCTDAIEYGPYMHPQDATFSDADVISTTSGSNAADRVLVVNLNGTPTTLYYNTLTQNGDGNGTLNVIDNGVIIHTTGGNPAVNGGNGTDTPGNGSANNGGGTGAGTGTGTDTGTSTGADTQSSGSHRNSDASTAAAVVGGIGLAGGMSYLIYASEMHMYLDEVQPLTMELGDAAFWADASIDEVWVDLQTETADVNIVTRSGDLSRHMAYRDGADGVKHYSYEDESSNTKADLAVNMQTREYFYTESGVKDGKEYVVKSHGWLKPGALYPVHAQATANAVVQ